MDNYITNTLLALFTGLLTFFTYLLWHVAQKQSKDANSTNRAFIFFKRFETHQLQDVWRLIPEWENCGTTPTKKMIYHINWKIFETEELNDSYHFPNLNDKEIPLVIGPKQILCVDYLDIPKLEPEEIKNNKKRLLIWGLAKYHDVFESTPQHHTKFCYELIFDCNKGLVLATYTQHNYAD